MYQVVGGKNCISVEKHKGKIPLKSPRSVSENNIKTNLNKHGVSVWTGFD
jgi:hypothetical protein